MHSIHHTIFVHALYELMTCIVNRKLPIENSERITAYYITWFEKNIFRFKNVQCKNKKEIEIR